MDGGLEGGSAADDLELRESHLLDGDVGDEHVAGHLADVGQEAEVQVLVLQPRDLQVPVHVSAVGVPVLQVLVVVRPRRRHRHPSVRTDAYFAFDELGGIDGRKELR